MPLTPLFPHELDADEALALFMAGAVQEAIFVYRAAAAVHVALIGHWPATAENHVFAVQQRSQAARRLADALLGALDALDALALAREAPRGADPGDVGGQ